MFRYVQKCSDISFQLLTPFTLKQLEEINIKHLAVERDLYFRQDEFSRCLARWKQEREK